MKKEIEFGNLHKILPKDFKNAKGTYFATKRKEDKFTFGGALL